MKQRNVAFTLIELLIVVAIIAILAAIAVPNFLEAQTRSKVARVRSDLRSAATAIEAYATDWNKYPWPKIAYVDLARSTSLQYAMELSTPVAYLSSTILRDPFTPDDTSVRYNLPKDFQNSYEYITYNGSWGSRYGGAANEKYNGYCISSYGPDRQADALSWAAIKVRYNGDVQTNEYRASRFYDPTNGTISTGDIGRFGGVKLDIGRAD